MTNKLTYKFMIAAKEVKKLRDKTGASMSECKKALEESSGDFEKAVKIMQKRGLKVADKKMGRSVCEGYVGSYIHNNGKVGVLVEVNCETDFVARNGEFQEFSHDLAMHIAALKPEYVDFTQISPEVVKEKREIFMASMAKEKKPKEIKERIIEGKMKKYFDEVCLMSQPFVKDSEKTVKDLVTEKIAKLGENIIVKRFVRFEIQ